MAKISDASLRALEPGKGIRDAALVGFCARKSRDGLRVKFEARRQGARPLFAALGHAPPLTVTQARAAATKVLAAHELGRPIPEESTAPRRVTGKSIDDAWPLYRDTHMVVKRRSDETKRSYEHSYARLDPDFRKRPLASFSPEEVAVEHARLVPSGASAAHASMVFVRTISNYVRKRFNEPIRNLVVDVDMTPPDPLKEEGDTVMHEGDLRPWWLAVQKHESPLRREAHLFCLLSGLRRTDLYTMKHEDFVADGSLPIPFFRIPKPKRRKPFDLLLSQPLLDCLDRAGAAWAAEEDAEPRHFENRRGLIRTYLKIAVGCRSAINDE